MVLHEGETLQQVSYLNWKSALITTSNLISHGQYSLFYPFNQQYMSLLVL